MRRWRYTFAFAIATAIFTTAISQGIHAEEGKPLGANGSDRGLRVAGALHAGRSVVLARHGMAATSHPLATQVALDIMKKGGSAVDAAIAANAMLSFAEPFMCGPGGDLFAIVWDPKTGQLQGLNASGRAPRSLSYQKLRALLGEAETMPLHGPLSVTVPGAVDGWFALHARFGKLPMAEILAPAVAYAREGVPTPPVIAHYWAEFIQNLRERPELDGLLVNLDRTFTTGGRAYRLGEIFHNPALADLLERISIDGRSAFYEGETAATIENYMKRAGGYITAADLAAHKSEWVTPVSVNYRGYDVYEFPSNSQGIAVLEMLNLIEGFDLAAMGRKSADLWHVLIEAKKLAYEDRARYYADPAFVPVPVAHLTSKKYAAERRDLIAMDRAMRSIEPGAAPIEGGDTIYLAAADETGLMISLIQSLKAGFGSGLVPDGLGFALQNRGGDGFSLQPGHASIYAPGKRPFHTIIPAFVMKAGAPLIAFGVTGGAMQPQGHVQVLVNLIDFGMNLQEAGDAARFRHVGSSQPRGSDMTDGGYVLVESGISPEVFAELRARGHDIRLSRQVSGGYQAVMRNPKTGVLSGATEMRTDGHVAGY